MDPSCPLDSVIGPCALHKQISTVSMRHHEIQAPQILLLLNIKLTSPAKQMNQYKQVSICKVTDTWKIHKGIEFITLREPVAKLPFPVPCQVLGPLLVPTDSKTKGHLSIPLNGHLVKVDTLAL